LSKDEARIAGSRVQDRPRAKGAVGRIAEQVRRLAAYRRAARVLFTPSPLLHQARINALVDGKELLMPGQRLREGFYLLRPYTVPFADLGHAVSYKGLARHGQRLSMEELAAVPVGLLLVDPLAVDAQGGFVGDGKGFVDLSVAILGELRALASNAEVYGVGEEAQLLSRAIALDAWDVRLAGLVTPQGLLPCTGGNLAGGRVLWQELPEIRVRKITPLWKLWQKRHESVDRKAENG